MVQDSSVGLAGAGVEKTIKGIRLGQGGVRGKAILIEQAHHVAINITRVGTFEMET